MIMSWMVHPIPFLLHHLRQSFVHYFLLRRRLQVRDVPHHTAVVVVAAASVSAAVAELAAVASAAVTASSPPVS